MNNLYLEKYADLASYGIPLSMGAHALVNARPFEAASLALVGYLLKREVRIIKNAFPRQRPAPYIPGQSIPKKDFDSFPSSHTARAFLGAGFAIGILSHRDPLSITALVLASLVGASRYMSKKHWFTDVVAGGMIGGIHGLGVATLIQNLNFYY